MITKDDLKKEVDKLPDNLVEEVFALLKGAVQEKKNVQPLTKRNFGGKLDKTDIRKAAYE